MRGIPNRIKQIELELTLADASAADRCARELLELAGSLRHVLPAASRRDPVGVIERLLARRSNALADRAERAAALAVPKLEPTRRAELISRLRPRLNALVPTLLTSDASADRLAGLAIVAATRSWSFVPQAAGIIGRGSADETALALDAITACAATLDDDRTPDPAAFERALAAVLDAASDVGGSSERPERRVLGIALMMLTPAARAGRFGRSAERWLDDAPDTIQFGLRAALRTLPGPLGTARAFELLVAPGLRRAAAERIAAATEPDEIAALFRRAHLVRRPLRRSVLRSRLDQAARLQLADATGAPGGAAARSLPAWIDALGAPAQARTASLEPLLASPDAAARLAAVMHAGEELRLDQSLDSSEPVAHAAALRLALPARRLPGAGLIDPAARDVLLRSPHASVRRLATRIPARGEVHPLVCVALRHDLARHPASVLDQLASRIARGESEAIAIAARFGLADQLLEPLSNVLRTGEPRAAASAARALASAHAPGADALLAIGIEHPDHRVRANAIESASARSRRSPDAALVLKLDDPHHRPAATSLRAQIAAGRSDDQTPDRVTSLLASTEPDRRAAGLWLTDRSAAELKPVAGRRWGEIAARVAESARRGETPRERRRATRCARRMLAVSTL